MDTTVKSYNTRSKSKKLQEKEVDKEKNMNLKNGNSDDDSNYTSDSEWEEQDDVSEFDRHEYRKFLSKIFPSNHLNKTISDGENIKKLTKCSSNNEIVSKKSQQKEKNRIHNEDISESNSDTEDDEDDEDEDYIDSDDESDDDSDNEDSDIENSIFGGEKGLFNIVFTVKGNDSEEETDEEENSEEETDEEENNEEENEDVSKNIVKNKVKNKHSREKKNKKQDKSVAKKSKHTNCKSSKEQQKKSTHEDNSVDEDSTKALRELMNVFKNKKKDSCGEAFKKMEKFLENEENKIKKYNEKKEKKEKVKNLKKFKKTLKGSNVMNDYKFFKTLDVKEQVNILKKAEEISKFDSIDKPYRLKLIESPIPSKYKASAMRKITSLNHMDPGSGEYFKVKQWVDTFMRIPFGLYRNLPVNIDDGIEKCNEFMSSSLDVLNNAVYGMDDAKMQIMQMMGNWISKPDAVGSAIAIKGPMGTGKTTLVKEGVSKILNRPFAFIALGGATDSSFLEGHSYTYEGSVWGKIVDIIIQSKCMNPVIYFDELDKVSDTAKGEEIIGILTHLTDTSQNSQFHDKYFSNVDFDLSKVLFIFSYNDESKVNPILKDRMYRIETKGYKEKEKTIIANTYLIPAIEKNINFKKGDITISDETLKYIITEYTQDEKGVRNLKRCLEILYTKLNLFRLMKPDTKLFNDVKTFKVEFPFTITNDVVNKLIKKNKQEQWYKNMYL